MRGGSVGGVVGTGSGRDVCPDDCAATYMAGRTVSVRNVAAASARLCGLFRRIRSGGIVVVMSVMSVLVGLRRHSHACITAECTAYRPGRLERKRKHQQAGKESLRRSEKGIHGGIIEVPHPWLSSFSRRSVRNHVIQPRWRIRDCKLRQRERSVVFRHHCILCGSAYPDPRTQGGVGNDWRRVPWRFAGFRAVMSPEHHRDGRSRDDGYE